MKLRARWAVVLLITGIAIGLLLDCIWVSSAIPTFSKLINIKPGPKLFGKVFFPDVRVGVLPVLSVVGLIISFLVMPFGVYGMRDAWFEAGRRWFWAMLGVLALPLCMLMGGFVFDLSEKYFPDWASKLAKSFGFAPKFYIFETEVVHLDANIASVIGLFIGLVALAFYLRK